MTLDKELMKVSTALRIAKQYYPQNKLEHALRVATYVSENTFIPYDLRDECVALAIMHDLVEDTNFKSFGLPDNFQNALLLLTKPGDLSYDEYCQRFKKYSTNDYLCAYWVKLADMKDHLSLTDTLTDRLKEKYLSGLRYLL